MLSSIKIDFLDDGAGIKPVIVIKLLPSDDPRDKLLKTLLQSEGDVLSIEYDNPLTEENRMNPNSTIYLRKDSACRICSGVPPVLS